MAEYIDRSVAIARLIRLEVTDSNATMADAKRVLEDIPAINIAPVVRCRDCKYLVRATVNSNGFLICNVSDMEITLEDFCSYGEKMDRGEKSG